MIPVTADGKIGKPVRWADLGGIDGSIFDRAFPFVREAPTIDPNPVFTREALLEPAGFTPLKKLKKRIARRVTTHDEESTTQRKRRLTKVVDHEDDDVEEPRRPGRIALPGRGIKIKKPKDDEKTENDDKPQGEKGGRLLRAALGAAVIAGSLRAKDGDRYPKPDGGEVIGTRMPGRSTLGSTMLK
jgi:hypothetical protein